MMSIREVARQLGISPASVRALIRSGRLAHYRPTPRRVTIAEADVEAHLAANRHQGISPDVPLHRVSLDPGTRPFGRVR